jgi:mannan endo-1,4-beta-mannosidase
MVSTGSEGEMGSVNDWKLYADVHASPYVDYLTYHMWIRNWSWFDQHKAAETWDAGLAKGRAYLNSHIDVAQKLNKPIVLEEFGLDRDDGAYDVKATTHYRDKFYREVFDLLYNRVKAGDAIAGYNFWAWNGSARTTRANFWWNDGDDFMGDPPQEQQGMYGVFDSDVTTILLIKEYADKMHALKK